MRLGRQVSIVLIHYYFRPVGMLTKACCAVQTADRHAEGTYGEDSGEEGLLLQGPHMHNDHEAAILSLNSTHEDDRSAGTNRMG